MKTPDIEIIHAMISAFNKEITRTRANRAPKGYSYEAWVREDAFRAVLATVRSFEEET